MRSVTFSGLEWYVKSSAGQYVGPGPNIFSDSSKNVWTDAIDRLHLRITGEYGTWRCAEVVTQLPLGFGRYRFVVESSIVFDPNVVFGLFLYEDDSREIDIEASRFGGSIDPQNAQFTIQGSRPGEPSFTYRFALDHAWRRTMHEIRWNPELVAFRSSREHGEVVAESSTTRDIPVGDLHVRINLWLYAGNADCGQPPGDANDVELFINKFEFESPSVTSQSRSTPA